MMQFDKYCINVKIQIDGSRRKFVLRFFKRAEGKMQRALDSDLNFLIF